jgi:anti-anti-sigma factor
VAHPLDSVGTVTAWEPEPGVSVVSAHGSIDERVAAELRDVLVPLAAADGALVVDLDDAHGLDDAVVSVLARAAHLAARRGVPLRIITHSSTTIDLIEESGLGDVVTVLDTYTEATS